MADDVDKFVLQYTVELKDSIARLEKLNEKMGKVKKDAKGSASEVKGFAADATSELGKLVPGLDAVSKAIRGMGAEFAVAGVAIGALAIGVKAVLDLQAQYNAQRSAGMDLGVSPTRVEEYQRKFVRQSGGYVNRDQATEGVKNFSQMANTAYSDPSRLGREARLMRMLGVNVGERGAAPTGLNDELTQLALGLQGKSQGDVQGIAKASGMSQDWLLTLQKLGPSIGQITELTQGEIDARAKSEDKLKEFNDELNKLKENFNELEIKLGQTLLPALDKFVQFITKIVDAVNKASTPNKPGKGKVVNGHWMPDHSDDVPSGEPTYTQNRYKIVNGHRQNLPDIVPEKKRESDEQTKKAQEKKEQDARDAAVRKLDETNKQGLQTANTMALAVNMFSGAVQSFSSAINLQQAWAAWAGEVGKAGGLPGSSGSGTPSAAGLTSGGLGNWRSSPYADAIKAASDKYKIDPQMIASIINVESHGDPTAVSSTGAGGLMQITKGNRKAYGLKDYTNISGNIDVGTRIYSEMLRKFNGDPVKALNGYNGNSDPNYVNKIQSAYGGGVGGIGESRQKMNVRSIQQQVADYLHVPLDQIQRGGVSQGDAGWAVRQLEAGVSNNIYDIQKQLAVGGMPKRNYAKLSLDLRDQARGLDMLRQYGDQVANRQQPGDQSLTVGERPIIINVNGVTDPKAVAEEVNKQITSGMNKVLQNYTNGTKG